MNNPFPGLQVGVSRKVPKDWEDRSVRNGSLLKQTTYSNQPMHAVLHPYPKSTHQIKVKNTAFAKTLRNFLGIKLFE